MNHGSKIMHGWNTVLLRMQPFVFIVFSLNNRELRTMVLNHSQMLGFVDGRMALN
uniref:Uncharacterized protein n=1 Tax=Arundo donax TaxID=35708 RepID=A0A0A9DBT1_ARUDO